MQPLQRPGSAAPWEVTASLTAGSIASSHMTDGRSHGNMNNRNHLESARMDCSAAIGRALRRMSPNCGQAIRKKTSSDAAKLRHKPESNGIRGNQHCGAAPVETLVAWRGCDDDQNESVRNRLRRPQAPAPVKASVPRRAEAPRRGRSAGILDSCRAVLRSTGRQTSHTCGITRNPHLESSEQHEAN